MKKSKDAKTDTSAVDETTATPANGAAENIPAKPELKLITKPESERVLGTDTSMLVQRRRPVYDAMKFVGLKNLLNVMEWLDGDFYALTDGEPISINGQTISVNKEKGTTEPFDNLLLVIHDPITNCYHVVAANSWIVRDGDLGYSIMGGSRFYELYEQAEFNV